MIAFLVSALASAVLAAPAPHDPGLSSVVVHREPGRVLVSAWFANADFARLGGVDTDADGHVDAAELAAATARLRELVVDGFRVTGASESRPELVDAGLTENRDIALTVRFDPAEGAVSLDIALLASLARGHRCYVAELAADESVLHDELLGGDRRHFAFRSPTEAPTAEADANRDSAATGGRFFLLGVEHILIGFDHLAFLLALLVGGATWRRAFASITAFTVAHSVTLAAAAFDVVHLPGRLVESSIAASILLVAIANLLQRGAAHRWPMALVFGLVHGFGFASVLRDLHVGGGDMLVPLCTFNLGVEVGQLAFASVVLPPLVLLARHRRTRWALPVLSALVGAAGLFWFYQRIAT